jgi:HlyD family secretion protein
MKLPKRWWAIALGVVALAFVLRSTVFQPAPMQVDVVTVARGVVEDAITNSQAGAVRSRHRARVGAERAGRVSAIPRREGASVRRGEAMLLLDSSTAQNQLDVARRDLDALGAATDAARSGATLARQQHDRTAQLRKSDLVSQGEMDQSASTLESAEAELKAAEARLSRARAAVRLAQDELDHMSVRAPFDGVVTQRFIEVGEPVVPGQPVLEVMDADRLYVEAPLDEIDIGRLREGLTARVTLDPYRGRTWRGVVSRVSPIVNDIKEQNRTLQVEVDLTADPAAPRPKPGTSADVEIILDARTDVLRVPTNAVIESKRVFVVAGGKIVSKDVQTGLKNWDWTEVRGGLKEGDQVVTSLEKQGVKAGARVTPKLRTDGGGAIRASQ